ncbi:DMT family transporter [Brachybacterium squillarum]|uniref:DMT family transporter n=1 Tax=Brachybacterium squillarum TaxID=661979 RepID=UPI000494AC7A|nr:SMR family transporter [Brachybacterium squillarum]
MTWVILIVSGMLEAVWATALSDSQGFKRPVPTVVFLVAMALSMAGLAVAMREIPTGTVYAFWVGIGAAFTVGSVMATGAEAVSAAKIVFLLGIIGGVIGLKLVPSPAASEEPAPDEEPSAR